jgi:hypothetical protein
MRKRRVTATLLVWGLALGGSGCIQVGPFYSGEETDDGGGDAAGDVGGDTGGAEVLDGASPGDVGDVHDAGPDVDAADPDVDGGEPDSDVVEPDTEVVAPDGEVVEPDSEVVEPDGDAVEPDSEVVEPDGDTGAPLDPLVPLGDEFDDPTTLDDWGMLHEDLGIAAPWTLLDVDETEAGALVLQPTNSGWFNGSIGPFLYKPVTGDFVVWAAIETGSLADFAAAPVWPYNAAGLMARAPGGQTAGERWVLHDIGTQGEGTAGTASKSTTFSVGTGAVTDKTEHVGPRSGAVALCRVGSLFGLYRLVGVSPTWELMDTYVRDDLPETLEVGIMATAWPPAPEVDPPADLDARVDFVRFATPQSWEDCLSVLEQDLQ